MKLKLTYKFIWAALVATAMLAACTKDPVPGKSDSDSAVTYRTITVSFDSPTKAKLDGTKPHFEANDAILLTDGTAFDTCYVKVEGTVETIQTKLAGKNLQAVYPMEAALCKTPAEIFAAGFKIPANQSGKFSDAMFCTGGGTDNNLSFVVQRPILRFYVDSTIAVSSIVIEYGGDKSFAENDSKTITVNAGDKGTLDKVTGERVCYVVVPLGVKANELTFRSAAKSQGKVVERKSPSDVVFQGATIYNAFIPYFIKVGDQKWGYCNVGAFYPEDPGYYFAWGDTTGYRFDFPNNVYVPQHSFYWNNYSFIASYDDTVNPPMMTFKKYVSYSEYAVGGNPDNKTTLDLKDDAAFQSWGGNWRMPTCSEFDKLAATDLKCSGAVGKYILFDDYGLILSLTGFGYDNYVTSYTTHACYWSSSKSKSGDILASFLHGEIPVNSEISDNSIIKISTEEHERRRGFPIRPIYDETTGGNDAVGLKLSAYTDGKTL